MTTIGERNIVDSSIHHEEWEKCLDPSFFKGPNSSIAFHTVEKGLVYHDDERVFIQEFVEKAKEYCYYETEMVLVWSRKHFPLVNEFYNFISTQGLIQITLFHTWIHLVYLKNPNDTNRLLKNREEMKDNYYHFVKEELEMFSSKTTPQSI